MAASYTYTHAHLIMPPSPQNPFQNHASDPPASTAAPRSVFDIDTIDLGPERRAYIEHKLERVWEVNSQGSIPYVPYLRAPYYIWIGQHHQTGRELPPLRAPCIMVVIHPSSPHTPHTCSDAASSLTRWPVSAL
jgi:hypothetical protein